MCVHAGDEWMEGQRMERLVDLNVCMCGRVCARMRDPACARSRPCLRACDPVCEDGMIDIRLDG